MMHLLLRFQARDANAEPDSSRKRWVERALPPVPARYMKKGI
jgi:hypothetical protein